MGHRWGKYSSAGNFKASDGRKTLRTGWPSTRNLNRSRSGFGLNAKPLSFNNIASKVGDFEFNLIQISQPSRIGFKLTEK